MSGPVSLSASTQAVNINPKAASAAASDALNFSGLAQLRSDAQAHNPQSIMAVAKQFEAVLMQEMLSAMSATSFGSDLTGKNAGPMFKSMFNQQIAQTVSQGQGMGVAQTLAREIASRYHLHWGEHGKPALAEGNMPVPGRNAALPSPAAASPSWVKPSRALVRQATAFVAAILPAVQSVARKLGVAPKAIIAQAALETGWGSHVAGNNLFGIKGSGSWQGPSVSSLTHEFENGVNQVETAAFRAYGSFRASVQNYAQLLLDNPRYQSALGQGNNVAAFAEALQQGGYASDPQYAGKLVAVADSPLMEQVMAGLPQGAAGG
ncbi:flagellar assembly peptidoglycan hydrolase FlgJ [Acidithiobacillus sp.]|jgi:flagellar protein FlgJ|uniref:flagellar assembly peptidoglycan hydrolase FlgJ n=1 Tax=Acidithiobacillus sp. TaxID=1872118 RepID=UPI0025B911D3|nr:flagellar assembly peptidoglycan hydrolase FlgJ [Acidithiobacillus sp.]